MANSGGNLYHPEDHLDRPGGHLDHAAGYTNSQMNVNSHMGNNFFIFKYLFSSEAKV